MTDNSPAPAGHNAYDYWRDDVIPIAADLRKALRNISRGKAWARNAENLVLLHETKIDRALKLDLTGIAQAALAITETSKRPLQETAVAKRLRLEARHYAAALEAAHAAEMEAANAYGYPDFPVWIDARYEQRLAIAREDASPVAMTTIWFVAEKVFRAIEQANKARAAAGVADKPIPVGLSSDGPVIQLILAALKGSWVFADLADADDPDGNACDRIYRELKKRLPSLPREKR
ncbi:MAG TPA: hypothetical protein VIF39_14580 [Hyphomicrobium sp.]